MKPNQLKRQAGVAGTILLTCLFALSLRAWAQAPSSRQIPFSGVVTTIQGPLPAQTLTLRVLDNSTPPVALYCETQTLDVNENGAISFNLGAGAAANPPCPSAPPGLNPADFASGSTRSLDVVDTNGNSVLANPIPLTAVAFALSPGPAGPTGPQGPAGPQGPQGAPGAPGVVQAITPGDSSITVAGTAATPSVAVSANGITNNHIANGALSPLKIAGGAATLGSNIFTGTEGINGTIALAQTSGPAAGVVTMGNSSFIHSCCYGVAADNTFVGSAAGSFNLAINAEANTALGARALSSNTSGRANTAVGSDALGFNTDGYYNVAIGSGAMHGNTSGASNTAVGLTALNGNSSGNNNAAAGGYALTYNTTGSNNTTLGYRAGVTANGGNANTTGSNNTFVGYQAGPGTSSQLTNAAAIGSNALVSESNALVLGGTGADAVKVGIGTATPAFTLDVSGTGNFSGAVTANSFTGNGSGLSNVAASGLAAGAYGNAYTFSNAANSFSGNGSGLTSLPAANLTGTVPSSALSGTYANPLAFSNAANAFSGNGGGLVNLDATHLTNGIRVQPIVNTVNIINGFSGNSVAGGIYAATIAGGGVNAGNNAVNGNGSFGTVGGGGGNIASGNSATVAGGFSNNASGIGATVVGGGNNIASGNGSFAAGSRANANQDGCFVWGDFSNVSAATPCPAANQFVARAAGGVIFYTAGNFSSGVQVAAGGGSWSSLSDRNVKEHFAAIDPRQLLARVTQLPIQSWNYKSQNATIRHIGPMAQDFYAAFHVGEDERHITDIDEAGVALAAIQGLNQKLDDEIAAQREQISRQDQQIRQQAEQIRELTTALRQFTSAYAEPERRK